MGYLGTILSIGMMCSSEVSDRLSRCDSIRVMWKGYVDCQVRILTTKEVISCMTCSDNEIRCFIHIRETNYVLLQAL